MNAQQYEVTVDITLAAVYVTDRDGGVWHPDENATREILGSEDIEGAAIRICAEAPHRGKWHC